jgi:hypothetical protein
MSYLQITHKEQLECTNLPLGRSHFETARVGANILFFGLITAQGALQKSYSVASILFVSVSGDELPQNWMIVLSHNRYII